MPGTLENSNNRWRLESTRAGLASSLNEAKNKLTALYTDPNTTVKERETQQGVVEDLLERLEGIDAQIKSIDDAASAAFNAQKNINGAALSESDAITKGYAELIRSTVAKKPISKEVFAALKDDTSTGGNSFLPKTVSSQIIVEPMVKNPLRGHSTYTAITNLELPKLAFSFADDSFINDGETAKEITATGSLVTFGRHKFKPFCDISETILKATDTALTNYVNASLSSALAAKEKTVAFAVSPATAEEHMSFYSSAVGITPITYGTGTGKTDMLEGIFYALADLEDMYADNAAICMKKSDYMSILRDLSNSSATFYNTPPENILGAPVFFCDRAVYPIVGDFSYSHFNYDPGVLYDTDKNVKTGMHSFVLTAWMDHRIKLASAFRIVKASE